MRSISKAPRLTALMACATLSLLAPVAADAAVSKYVPAQDARDFQGSIGGWDAASEPDQLCLLPATICPAISGGREAQGGAGGGGHLATRIDTTLANTTVATNTGLLRSPAFRYRGAQGRKPDSLSLRLKRKSELADLLAVAGNTAEMRAEIVPAGAPGAAVEAISSRELDDESSWSPVRGGELSPGELELGQRYRIVISTEFTTSASLLPSGSVGYDDVVLSAKRRGSGGNGGNGGNGGGQLGNDVTQQIGGAAVLKGRKARVRVGCPASVKPGNCRLRVSGLLRRGGPKVTNTKRLNLRGGKHRTVRLKVTRKRRAVARRGRLFVRVKYVAADGRGRVIKRVRVRSRR